MRALIYHTLIRLPGTYARCLGSARPGLSPHIPRTRRNLPFAFFGDYAEDCGITIVMTQHDGTCVCIPSCLDCDCMLPFPYRRNLAKDQLALHRRHVRMRASQVSLDPPVGVLAHAVGHDAGDIPNPGTNPAHCLHTLKRPGALTEGSSTPH
jgi:hypothetical protein